MGWTDRYWKENRERLLKERKEKYANDPEYRQKVLERARKYREEQRAKREAARENPVIHFGSGKVPAMTEQQLCDKMGIEKKRLKYLHRVGYVPMPLVLSPVRLYTHRQFDMVRDLHEFLVQNLGQLRAVNEEVTAERDAKIAYLKKNWSKP